MHRCLAVALLGLGACQLQATRFTATNAPPREAGALSPEQVEVFTVSRPERPFVEVGILSTAAEKEPGAAAAALRREAAQRGCDAIVIGAPVEQTSDFGDGSAVHRLVYAATCLVYR